MIPRQTDPGVDESRLIEQVRAGHREAFEYFVRRYHRKITRVAYRLLRDAGEADCAAQESFLRAYQNLDDFREGSTFETWLTRICINWCKDRLKRRRLAPTRPTRRSPSSSRRPAIPRRSGGPSAARSVTACGERSTRCRPASG